MTRVRVAIAECTVAKIVSSIRVIELLSLQRCYELFLGGNEYKLRPLRPRKCPCLATLSSVVRICGARAQYLFVTYVLPLVGQQMTDDSSTLLQIQLVRIAPQYH